MTLITLSFGTNHESKALIEYTQKTGNAVYGTNNTFLKWPFFPPTNSKITNLNAPAKTSNENNPNLNINPLHDMLWEKIKNEKNRTRLREREVRDRRITTEKEKNADNPENSDSPGDNNHVSPDNPDSPDNLASSDSPDNPKRPGDQDNPENPDNLVDNNPDSPQKPDSPDSPESPKREYFVLCGFVDGISEEIAITRDEDWILKPIVLEVF